MDYRERPLSPTQVTPRGFLAARLRLSLDRLIRKRAMHTAYAGWGADQIGRWIGAAILEAQLLADQSALPLIREKVEELRAAQDAHGFYYGAELRNTPERLRECWFGQGRGIWNLLEYYAATGDEAALASVLAAADHAVAERPAWEISKPLCGGIESAVGPMARLGRMTRRPEYLAYARYMADNIQHQVARPSPIPTAHVEPTSLHTHEEKPFFHHTHSYLNTTHGVVDLAVITGEHQYAEQAKQVFEDSLSSVWIQGGFPESYGDYYERIDETCSAVDWMMLALKLFALTGEARYLDSAELTAVNQLPFGQDTAGTFTCYRSLNRHHWADAGNRGCPQNECCAMSGGWGLAQIALHTITQNASGLSVNLPFEVRVLLEYEGAAVPVSQSVWTGRDAMVQTLQIDNRAPKELEVKVRCPYWCAAPSLRVNGMPCSVSPQNGFFHVSCPAHSACSLELHLPMTLQVVPAGRNLLTKDRPAPEGSGPEQGLQYGPYVLMLNRMMYPNITQRDIRVTVKRDSAGRPLIHQEYPAEWPAHYGAIPLFVAAAVPEGIPVSLTPCANMTMTALTSDDPYLLRFAEIL